MCLFTGLPFVDIFIQLQWNHSIRFGKSLFIGRYALFFGIYTENLEVHSRGKRKWQIKNRPYQKGRSNSRGTTFVHVRLAPFISGYDENHIAPR